MIEHEWTAADADGKLHRYTCTKHPTSEGSPLVLHLAGLVVDPILSGLGPVVVGALAQLQRTGGAALGQGGKIDGRALLVAVAQMAADPEVQVALDFGRISAGVRAALAGMSQPVQYSLLRYTNRDGQPLIVGGKPTPLYEEAYPGNYAELGRALWGVVRINRFLPALDTIEAASKALGGLMPGMPGSDA